jgi:hypothetical protein
MGAMVPDDNGVGGRRSGTVRAHRRQAAFITTVPAGGKGGRNQGKRSDDVNSTQSIHSWGRNTRAHHLIGSRIESSPVALTTQPDAVGDYERVQRPRSVILD